MVARNLREIIPAFFVGPGGQPLTEEQARTRQELAESLLAQATDTSPTAGGWTSVLAKGVQGFAAGRQRNRAEEGLRLAGERDADLSRSLLRGVSLGSPATSSSLPLGAAPVGAVASQPLDPISDRVAQAHGGSVPNVDPRIATGIVETANALGIDPVDLATTISYETGGTFDPTKKGPTTQWGQHMGLIQFGEPQAQEHGVDWARPIESQLGANGAVASYLRRAGVKPGMGLLDVYSAINAGAPGLYNRSDANNGGAPGTVRDKVEQQMAGHRAKAQALLAPYLSANVAPDASAGLMAYAPQQPQGGALASAPFASAGLPVAPVTEDVIVATTPEEVLAAEMATGMIPDPLSLPENQISMDYVEPQGGAYVDPVVARANPNGIMDLGPGRPGERRRGPDGQMYQYVETSGMAGDSGGWGWIRAAEGGPIGMGIDPNDPSTIPAMAGGTRDVITALDPAMGYFPPAPSASRNAFPPSPTAQAAASSPSPTGGGASVGGVNPAIIEALSSPYASAQTKQIASMLLEQQMGEQRAIQDRIIAEQQAAAERERLRQIAQASGINPIYAEDPELWKQAAQAQFNQPTDVREYEYALGQGYQGSFADFQRDMKKAGATTVDARNMGSIPQGYRVVYDAAGNPVQMEPIPGGPADTTSQDAQKVEQTQTWNRIVNQEIGRALDIIESSGLPTTGAVGDILSGVGGTGARDLRGLLDTIKSNAGFDRLQAMRDSSPTGGALGQVSERELAFLQSTIGNLEQSQSREQLEFNLRRLQRLYQNMLEGRRAYDGLIDEPEDAAITGRDLPEPKSKAEMDALPSGTRFRAPDGSIRIKP